MMPRNVRYLRGGRGGGWGGVDVVAAAAAGQRTTHAATASVNMKESAMPRVRCTVLAHRLSVLSRRVLYTYGQGRGHAR